ncbi:zinc finger MYM-type protein 1-like [Palaemon carinicauda]|uniref:zinc finger MYM-type protein 1-like n=1 Tax=Palaemon carinicauda TaxID=392227 RepID=UPI0035B5B1FB
MGLYQGWGTCGHKAACGLLDHQQHCALHKENKYAKLEGDPRKIALQELKNGKQKQKQFFQSMLQGNATTEASYKVAYLVEKKRMDIRNYFSRTGPSTSQTKSTNAANPSSTQTEKRQETEISTPPLDIGLQEKQKVTLSSAQVLSKELVSLAAGDTDVPSYSCTANNIPGPVLNHFHESIGGVLCHTCLRAEDDKKLKVWLSNKVSYTSVPIQNEILKTMANAVVREICNDVNQMSTQFGLITDGTQDIQGNEQEAVCVRYVDDKLNVHEELLGLYQVSATTGVFLSKMLQDTVISLQLPIQHLRAQTYDGASNMSGKYKGCQAEIKKVQPLALCVHCGAHVTHLIISKAIPNSLFIKNALDNLQELGTLYRSSGKFKHMYLNIHTDDLNTPSPTSLKPICPTRWLTRYAAVKAVLDNYPDVLAALQEAAKELGSTTASRAAGLYKCLFSGECLLGLYGSLPLIQCLENFNKSLQGSKVTVSGMLEAAEVTIKSLQSLRCEHKFKRLFEEAEQKLHLCDLDAIPLPRKKKIPKRLDQGLGFASNYCHDSAEEFYRVEFFSVIDAAVLNIKEYFTSTDLTEYQDLSSVLLTGTHKPEIITKYPELNESLNQQLDFFHNQFKGSTVEDYRKIFADMVPEVRRMFPQVEALLRLLLVSPASSCTAERSFGALRRLKTWLRSSMSQQRLNHLMICHVHRDRLATLSPQAIAEEFIRAEDKQRTIFGRF